MIPKHSKLTAAIGRPTTEQTAADIIGDHFLGDLIDTWAKCLIIDAYSFGRCSEELAIRLIREHGLRYA